MKQARTLFSITSVVLVLFLLLQVLTSTVSAQGAASLSLSPSSKSVSVNEAFDVQIILNTAGAQTSGTDVQIQFDNTKLNVTDITNGTIYDQYVGKNINNATGILTLSGLAGSTDTLFTGTGTFATIRFRAIAAGTASVNFIYTTGSKTDTNVADFNTQNEALGSVTNATYTIGGSTTSATATPATGNGSNPQPTSSTPRGGLPVTADTLPIIILLIISIGLIGSGIFVYRFFNHPPVS